MRTNREAKCEYLAVKPKFKSRKDKAEAEQKTKKNQPEM